MILRYIGTLYAQLIQLAKMKLIVMLTQKKKVLSKLVFYAYFLGRYGSNFTRVH